MRLRPFLFCSILLALPGAYGGEKAIVKNVTTEEAAALLTAEDRELVILDIRTPEEFA